MKIEKYKLEVSFPIQQYKPNSACKGIKKVIYAVLWKNELRRIDRNWHLYGNGYRLFPPSIYYKYTRKEVEQIKKETVLRIRKILEE